MSDTDLTIDQDTVCLALGKLTLERDAWKKRALQAEAVLQSRTESPALLRNTFGPFGSERNGTTAPELEETPA